MTSHFVPSSMASAIWCALTLVASAASAQTFQGKLNDPLNTALVSSDLSAASFVDDYAIANSVALYSFSVGATATVSILSTGFAAGGVDPYFTLFSGAGTGATFVSSNYDQAFGLKPGAVGGDFLYEGSLTAGTYQIALGTFANMSFAENLGSGTLADGFIGLGEPDSLHDTSYVLVVDTHAVASPVPEPSSWMLLGAGGLAVAMVTRRQLAKEERANGVNTDPVNA